MKSLRTNIRVKIFNIWKIDVEYEIKNCFLSKLEFRIISQINNARTNMYVQYFNY